MLDTQLDSGLDPELSLCKLFDPAVLANPYPLYRRIREQDPVHWDAFLHSWVVTRYPDVLTVLHRFSADRIRTPEQLSKMGCEGLNPIARMMMNQLLFMDAPSHTRLRGLAAVAFSPRRVEELRAHVQQIASDLLDGILEKAAVQEGEGKLDVIAGFAEPFPAIVTAGMLGVPIADHMQLKDWSADFAEMLGNLQQNTERAPYLLRSLEEMTLYFRAAVREKKKHPTAGLISSLITAELEGGRLTEEEVVANSILTMIGGQETTTNLIGNGLLLLLHRPSEMARLLGDFSLIPSAVEEFLRYDAPVQHTARIAPEDVVMGGKQIRKGQSVIPVLAAANRDPERFPDPDRMDVGRTDNRHLAFGWASHFCFGAPLARMEGQIAFEGLLRRLPGLRLQEGVDLEWRENLGLRGLKALPVRFAHPLARGRGSVTEPRASASGLTQTATTLCLEMAKA
jgi:pimeloyl-[acyl-carrier protein] synthase